MLKKREIVYCSNEIQKFVKENQGLILQKSNYLLKRSESLNYEGKVYLSQKLQGLRSVQKEVNGRFISYIKVEEKVIFPFLETHIPRLVPFIHMFREENREIKKSLKEIDRTLKLIRSAQNAKERREHLGRLGGKTTVLYYLIQSHFEMEENNLYKFIGQELHSDEQNLLFKKLVNYDEDTSHSKGNR